MIASLQAALNSNPQTAALMGSYKQMFAQIAAQPEPGVFATIFSSVWSYMLWGFIVALIVAAVVKREPQLFDNTNSEE